VERALGERRHLIVDAGTGTGKDAGLSAASSAHRPARHHRPPAPKHCRTSSYFRDIPFIESLLGALHVCYMKGRANYLCRHKLGALKDQPFSLGNW